MRRRLIAGNWKMNGDYAALAELDAIAAAAGAAPAVDVAICPSFTLIQPAKQRQPALLIGAQDCDHRQSGAHTGCVSPVMVREAGAGLVILGHSERRADNGEDNALVHAKAGAAMAAGLVAIICVGETEAERDAGRALDVVAAQIAGSVPRDGTGESLVIAYEPVWAIGTGRTPTRDDIATMHAEIRAQLCLVIGAAAQQVRLLYGGSVKPSNAAEILCVDDVDGALVGGASLSAKDFVPIVAAAARD